MHPPLEEFEDRLDDRLDAKRVAMRCTLLLGAAFGWSGMIAKMMYDGHLLDALPFDAAIGCAPTGHGARRTAVR